MLATHQGDVLWRVDYLTGAPSAGYQLGLLLRLGLCAVGWRETVSIGVVRWWCLVPGNVALLAGGPGLGVPGWAEGKRGRTWGAGCPPGPVGWPVYWTGAEGWAAIMPTPYGNLQTDWSPLARQDCNTGSCLGEYKAKH